MNTEIEEQNLRAKGKLLYVNYFYIEYISGHKKLLNRLNVNSNSTSCRVNISTKQSIYREGTKWLQYIHLYTNVNTWNYYNLSVGYCLSIGYLSAGFQILHTNLKLEYALAD